MMAADMPAGYAMTAEPNAVAHAVLAAPTWSVLALTLDIELFTQAHYRASIDPDPHLSELWKDVFLFHWKEESQHAILDELEFLREDAKLSPAERDAAVDGLIALVAAVDAILQAQARADARYFFEIAGTAFNSAQCEQIRATVLKAYRWQYIVSGVMEPRFQKVLFALVDQSQAARIHHALAPLTNAVPLQPEVRPADGGLNPCMCRGALVVLRDHRTQPTAGASQRCTSARRPSGSIGLRTMARTPLPGRSAASEMSASPV
jgi:hypothetical protein